MAVPNVFVGSTSEDPNVSTSQGPAFSSGTGGQLFATSQSSPAVGGTGGGTPPPSGNGDTGGQVLGLGTDVPLEQGPDGADFGEIDAAYNEGLSALNQFEGTLQPSFDLQSKQAEAGGQQRIGDARAEEASRLGEFGEQRTTEENRTGNANADARRMASELLQGIQARFGGTTGTGQFSSEILGSQATKNIAGNQQILQETLGKISSAENKVKDTASRLIEKIESDTNFAKEQARIRLQQAMSDIAGRKAELSSRKAELKTSVLGEFNRLISDINARNTSFKQELFLKAQSRAEELNSFKQSAFETYQAALKPFENNLFKFDVGGQEQALVPDINAKGKLSGVQISKGPTPDDDLPDNPFSVK